MKKLWCILLAAVMVLSLAACQKKPEESQGTEKQYREEVSMSTWAPISILNTWEISNTIHQVYQRFPYNQLLNFDYEKGEFLPCLATKWESEEGGKTWHFWLRDDVKFSNGEPFEADDVAFTLLDGPSNPQHGENVLITGWKDVESVEVVNAHEVKVHLKTANQEYLYNCYLPGTTSMVNRDAYEKDGTDGLLIGTGGWTVDKASFMPSESVTLNKWEDSWVWKVEGATPTKKVTLKYVSDSKAALAAGEVANALGGYDDILENDPNVDVGFINSMAYIGIIVNVNEYSIFHDDPWLRKAVSYAIDREAYSKIINDTGKVHPIESCWGEGQFGYYDNWEHKFSKQDMDYAKECLAKSKQAGKSTIHIDFYSLASRAEQAAMVAEMLKPLGIDCTITAQDSTGLAGAFTTAKEQHVYDMILSDFTWNPAGGAKKSWFCNGGYRAFYQSDEADRLFALIQGGETVEIRKQACIDMQKLWYEEQPYIMICNMVNYFAEYKGVDGLAWNPDTKFDWHRVTWEK